MQSTIQNFIEDEMQWNTQNIPGKNVTNDEIMRRQSLYCSHPDILRRLTLRSSLERSIPLEICRNVTNMPSGPLGALANTLLTKTSNCYSMPL